MQFGKGKKYIASLLAMALSQAAQGAEAVGAEMRANPTAEVLPEVVVSMPRIERQTANAESPRKAAPGSDTASLLGDTPGLSLQTGGGISSLPAIHGLGDDRVDILVDGVKLTAACPNHMNPPLSYIDPAHVGKIEVFAGVAPVSAGADSLGGTIRVESKAPQFAPSGQLLTRGEAGGFFRTNGNARGTSIAATLASDMLSMRYSASLAESGNYRAAKNFKPAGPAAMGQEWLPGDVVGSSRYRSLNQEFAMALKSESQLIALQAALQNVPREGFPNQRMDLSANDNTLFSISDIGQYEWGTVEARIYHQRTRHGMNFGADKQFWYGTIAGMPMNSDGKTTGAKIKAELELAENDILRVGAEIQNQTLNDWWPPSGGSMGPNAFWNIRDGRRDRFGLFAEWDGRLGKNWNNVIGVRNETVKTDAKAVQGYADTMMMNQLADSSAFNGLAHQRRDNNWDLSALSKFKADETLSLEIGYARKTRSPNLHERYSWSTASMMMIMNNFAGDGNGYVGNIDLRPEVAHTLSATANWHDAEKSLRITPYYTHVQGYIDAVRCPKGSNCYSAANTSAKTGFVNLQYANQRAQLYGIDISARLLLGRIGEYGNFTASGVLGYTRGVNLSTGDNLYNIMPLNARFSLTQRLENWSNTAELQLVAAKTNVSNVRNETRAGGYGLLNLRSSHELRKVRFDIGVENVMNKFYLLPMGGAYLGQGMTMSAAAVPWGVAVPGMGRSIYTAMNFKF